MRILAADDDEIALNLLQALLAQAGHDCIAVTNGQAAWEIMQGHNPPRILMLDWMMPELDGLELCRRLRAAKPPAPARPGTCVTPYCHIIIVTARNGREDILQALDAGADDFLSKPFNCEELHGRLGIAQRLIAYEEALLHTQQQAAVTQHLASIALMSSGIAHEINQPLNAMQIMVANLENQLRRPPLDAAALLERTAKLAGQIQRIERIISHMRRLTKVRETPALETVSLARVVENVLRIIGAEPANKHIAIGVEHAPDLPPVLANPIQAEQVVFNLINNACQALESHPRAHAEIKLTTAVSDTMVTLCVADNGPGLDFDPLTGAAAGRAPTEHDVKMGIGLKLVRKFVEDWGGKITLANRDTGGAAITIAMRAAPDRADMPCT